MTTPPMLPSLPGQGWSVKKTPIFSTRVSSHVSGREVRAANYAHALYQFELVYDSLSSRRDRPGLLEESLQILMGFYLSCRGQFGTFLYEDPTDHYAGNSLIGYGDGSTVSFTASRKVGSSLEPVSYVTSLGAVTLSGSLSSVATLAPPNSVVFGGAPAAGAMVAASFRHAYLCRFLDDQVEFENFMNGLWSVSSLKFRSVR